MHHVEAPLRYQQLLALPEHILQRAQRLVAGDVLGRIGVADAVLPDHVGRVHRDNMKGGRAKQVCRLPDVSRHDMDPVLQVVPANAPPGHVRALLLDLQAGVGVPLVFCLQKDGEDARPRPQIQRPLPRLHFGKGGQKHRVHAEAEPAGALYDPVSLDLQVVQALARLQITCHLTSTLRSSPPAP